MHKDKQAETENSELHARRKLLKMAAYVPPAILGVMIAGNKPAMAGKPPIPGSTKVCKGGGTIVISAGGTACCPCVPTDPKYDPYKCALKKCQLGNCAACPAVFVKKKHCKIAAAACGCTCVKDPVTKLWSCN